MTNPIDELLAAIALSDEYDYVTDCGCGEPLLEIRADADRVREWRAREMSDEELVTLYASAASGMRHLAGLRAVERAVRGRSS